VAETYFPTIHDVHFVYNCGEQVRQLVTHNIHVYGELADSPYPDRHAVQFK